MQTLNKEVIEDIIDEEGLREVIEALAAICRDKADHLRGNWQDKTAAKAWDRDANKLDKLALVLTN